MGCRLTEICHQSCTIKSSIECNKPSLHHNTVEPVRVVTCVIQPHTRISAIALCILDFIIQPTTFSFTLNTNDAREQYSGNSCIDSLCAVMVTAPILQDLLLVAAQGGCICNQGSIQYGVGGLCMCAACRSTLHTMKIDEQCRAPLQIT